ncbi:hypothetical protein [Geopseudomonas aromaticivorans]
MTSIDQRLTQGTATPAELQTLERYNAIIAADLARRGLGAPRDGALSPLRMIGNRLKAKSSLFDRLLRGKPALVIPAPLSFSHPWYSVVESNTPQEVLRPEEWKPSFIQRAEGAPEQVLIHQTPWDIVERIGSEELIVTQPEWQRLGFRWRLWREILNAEHCKAFIAAWHDTSLQRITTEAQLRAEGLHFARKWRDELQAALQLDDDEDSLLDMDVFDQHMHRQGREHALKELAERRERGLPALPTDEEIEVRASEEAASRLRDDWFIEDGRIYHRTWRIQRIAPAALGTEHYLGI